MPGLPKFLYEQLSYHKILPFVCNLSMKISLRCAILVKHVLCTLAQTHGKNFSVAAEASRQEPVKPRYLCDNFRRNLCPITKSSAQN